MTLLSLLENIINMQEERIKFLEQQLAILKGELDKSKPKNFKKNKKDKEVTSEVANSSRLSIPELSDN